MNTKVKSLLKEYELLGFLFFILAFIILSHILILSFQTDANAQPTEGIHMRRFYDEETGTLCYTVFGDDNGLSTSCVQVGSCDMDENPKFFTVK